MNSLSSTTIYKLADEVLKVTDTLKSLNVADYTVPKDSYAHYSEFRTFKYPMAKVVTDALRTGVIIPTLLAEPINPKAKSIILPNLFVYPTVVGGNPKTAVDLSAVASYIRTKGTGAIEVLKIDQKTFYGFCQAGTTYHLLRKHDASLSNGKFADTVAELYAPMLAKSLDRIHPFSQNPEDYDLLTFIIAAFFLRTLVGQEVKASYKNASELRIFSDRKISTISQSAQLEKDLNSVEALIQAIEMEFNTVKRGAFSHHAITNVYTKMYGTNATFAFEHFFSFVNMLQMSNVWMGLFNDRAINTVAANKLKTIEEILAALSL